MDKLQFIERTVQDNSWAVFLFIGSFLLVAVAKSVFTKQFSDFLTLAYTDKYIKLYGGENDSLKWFSGLLIFIQLISYSFFIHIISAQLGFTDKNNFFSFLGIFTFVLFFISLKFLLEKSISFLFEIQEFYNRFLFQQATYRMYLGLFLLLGTFIFFYSKEPVIGITYILVVVFLLLNLIFHLISFRTFQKEIKANLFYFILYLCTFEIAPYYFIYYWLTNH